MTVIMVVLKEILWLLLALIVLLLAALLIPITADLCYEKGQFTAALRVIGLRFSIYPFKEDEEKDEQEESFLQGLRRKKQKKKAKKTAQKAQTVKSSVSEKQPPQAAQTPALEKQPGKTAQEKTVAEPPKIAQSIPSTKQKPPKKAVDFVQSSRQLQTIVCTAGSAMRKILAGLKIHQIRIVLPVHRDDAAATAIAVGRTHTMLHASLGVLNNFLNLSFKQLDIYPDYTDDHAGEEHFSCKITTHLIIMVVIAVWALFRLKKENVI